MNRIKMGKLNELSPGAIIVKRILARRIAVVNDAGKIYAIEGDCKHMKATLETGKVCDGSITCRWHNWKYELTSGECTSNPPFKLKTYDIDIVDDDIYVIF